MDAIEKLKGKFKRSGLVQPEIPKETYRIEYALLGRKLRSPEFAIKRKAELYAKLSPFSTGIRLQKPSKFYKHKRKMFGKYAPILDEFIP